MEGNMVSYMGSLVCDWLLSAGDKKLAEKFRKEAKPEPLPPNSPGWLTSSSTTRIPFPRRGRPSLLSTETRRRRKRWEIMIF